MTRTSRVLIFTAAATLGSLFLLVKLADRYRRLLEVPVPASRSSGAEARARTPATRLARRIDDLIAVRRALAAERSARGRLDEEAWSRATAAGGLSRDEYDDLEHAYRQWREGSPAVPPELAAAFTPRRGLLASTELEAQAPVPPAAER